MLKADHYFAGFLKTLFLIFMLLVSYVFIADSNYYIYQYGGIKNSGLVTLGLVAALVLAAALITYLFGIISASVSKWMTGVNTDILYLFIIFVLSTLPRLWLINSLSVTPNADFATYHKLAVALSEGGVSNNRYISIFPHVLGYPEWLSGLYKLFGQDVRVAQYTNLVLYALMGILVYLIGSRFMRKGNALFAALFTVLLPSNILYTVLVSTEALFSVLCLLSVYLYLRWGGTGRLINRLPVFFLLGILLAMGNAVRPLALIFLIALVLYDLFTFKVTGLKSLIGVKLLPVLVFIGSFFILTGLHTNQISKTIGMEAAASPLGFNLYVGLNTDARGAWNEADAKVFDGLVRNDALSAQGIQDTFRALAMDRLKAMKKPIPLFILDKMATMWGNDSIAVSYIKNGYQKEQSILDMDARQAQLYLICGFAYGVLLLISFYSLVVSWKDQNRPVLLFILFILGIAALHLMVEASGRYHYPAIPFLALLAASGLRRKRGYK